MKILGVKWFTTLSNTIGIVFGEDTVTKEKKAYIGVGFGEDEEVDKIHIADNGTRFPAEIAEQLIKN